MHVTSDLFSSGIQVLGHRQRSVLDRSGVLRNYTCNTYNEQLTDNVTVDRVRVAGKFELLSIGGGPKLTSRSRSAAQSID